MIQSSLKRRLVTQMGTVSLLSRARLILGHTRTFHCSLESSSPLQHRKPVELTSPSCRGLSVQTTRRSWNPAETPANCANIPPEGSTLGTTSAGLESGTPRSMARVYADVNQQMPRSYWDYDSVNISWGVLENYEVVRKIGKHGD